MTETPHGYRRYQHYGCRCATCRYDNSRYRVEYLAGRGAYVVGFVPVEPVRAHMRALSGAGVSVQRLSARTGVSVWTLRLWRSGRTRLARKDLAERVLAVSAAAPADVGVHRRIQALVADGRPIVELAARIGWNPANLMGVLRQNTVRPETRAKLVALYDDLSATPPVESPVADRARRRAIRDCWFPVAAWDEDTIDDPDALPCLLPPLTAVDRGLELLVQHVVAGHRVKVTAAVRFEIARRMPDRLAREIAAVARCSVQNASALARAARAERESQEAA